jgi:hypothetical protein
VPLEPSQRDTIADARAERRTSCTTAPVMRPDHLRASALQGENEYGGGDQDPGRACQSLTSTSCATRATGRRWAPDSADADRGRDPVGAWRLCITGHGVESVLEGIPVRSASCGPAT